MKTLKTEARIRAPGVVFGNHAGDSLPSAMFVVQHGAHVRAVCTKIVALLKILGGVWLVISPWGENHDVLSNTYMHTHTHRHRKRENQRPCQRWGEKKVREEDSVRLVFCAPVSRGSNGA